MYNYVINISGNTFYFRTFKIQPTSSQKEFNQCTMCLFAVRSWISLTKIVLLVLKNLQAKVM